MYEKIRQKSFDSDCKLRFGDSDDSWLKIRDNMSENIQSSSPSKLLKTQAQHFQHKIEWAKKSSRNKLKLILCRQNNCNEVLKWKQSRLLITEHCG